MPGTTVAIAAERRTRRTTRAGRSPDVLAARRAELQEVEARAVQRLNEMMVDEFVRVPRLMLAVADSLAAASVLELARLWSERSERERGTPWIDMPQATWLAYTGLSEQEWVDARRSLRDRRLIRERRRYDLARSELVCDISFDADVFASLVAELKARLKARFSEEARARRRGHACAADGGLSTTDEGSLP